MEQQTLSDTEQKILNCFIGDEKLTAFEIVAVIGFSSQHIGNLLRVMEAKGVVISTLRKNRLYWNKTRNKKQGEVNQ